MLTAGKIKKIRKILEKSQNPLFLFDNDADGLCSFLILKRALDRGKGIAIKSFPSLNEIYLKKVEELNPDLVVILDKAEVESSFINRLYEKSIPVLWIDHHKVKTPIKILKKVSYYNSAPSSEPVTYIAHKIFNNKKDDWLAMIGCISDIYLPNFADKFAEKNPDLFKKNISAFEAKYSTEIGKAVGMFNFGLKDTTTNVVNLTKFLSKADNFYDLYEENSKTKQFQKRYKELQQVYKENLKKAEAQISKDKKLIFFTYSGETSMSSELSNELQFKHKDKIIAVAYKNLSQGIASISLRGENIRKILLRLSKRIEGVTGGGHDKACGARIPIDELDKFQKELEKEIFKKCYQSPLTLTNSKKIDE